jgi:hypothetical protein
MLSNETENIHSVRINDFWLSIFFNSDFCWIEFKKPGHNFLFLFSIVYWNFKENLCK